MSEEWYNDLPDDVAEKEINEAYERATKKIREGISRGLGFDDACKGIDVDDGNLKKQIIDDMLKVLIAEEHFGKKVSLSDLSERLKVSREHLESARSSMLEEVVMPHMKDFYENLDPGDAPDN